MNRTWAIARKEWKAAFLSPVALIFLGIFLCASLFVFFFLEDFFARNIADAKPFFRHMPWLLVLLTSAFTMRLWSEEARTGTLELLLTLPLRLRDVVLGKFLAGVGLVAVALALTLPVPIFIEIVGDLDWGPVVGGYLGLLLLAAAYLAIGMLISSLTSSQLVALMLSVVVCGSLVGLGLLPEVLTLGLAADEVLRALGTGSRFASMLRGVLSLGDLVYYVSLAGLALAANALVLEVRRWGHNRVGRQRRSRFGLAMGLLAANLLVLNLGLALAGDPRADLTEWDEYSLAPVTESLVRGAPEPLLVRGYFSDQTHPLLDPLVPQIRDFLRELQAAGGDELMVEFVDPTADEELAAEAKRDYGIGPVPFHFEDRHAESVVNAYFHILVRYGDRHEVLDYRDLIKVDFAGDGIQVRLRNLEYDVARAIQKTVYSFKSLETLCAQLPAPAELRIIASSSSLPQQLAAVPERIETVADEFAERCGDRFRWTRVDPDDPDTDIDPEQLARDTGIQPMMSLTEGKPFYLDMVLTIGDEQQVLSASGGPGEKQIRDGLRSALQRHAPGFLKTVGLVVPEQMDPRLRRMQRRPPQRKPSFEMLERELRQSYQLRRVKLDDGRVPGDIDVLLVLAPENLGEKARFALDQYLMRGGALIVATAAQTFMPAPDGGLSTKPVDDGLDALLADWGVQVGDGVVLDERNLRFPVPVQRQLGSGLVVQEVQMVDYPPFAVVEGEGLAGDNPATAALSEVVVHYGSSVSCIAPAGGGDTGAGDEAAAACRPLLSTSERAWQVESAAFDAAPDYQSHGDLGYEPPAERDQLDLAVVLRRRFDSHYKDKQPPVISDAQPPAPGAGADEQDEAGGGYRAGVIEQSPPDTPLVVLGSSSFVSDMTLALAMQISEINRSNLQLMANLVDWTVEDPALLQIRSRERMARTLGKLENATKVGWEVGLFGFAALAVIAIGLFTLGRRGRARPIRLTEPSA